MPSQKRLSELIHSLYAAAEEPGLWERFLDMLAADLGSAMTVFIAVGEQGAVTNVSAAARAAPHVVRLYNEHWAAEDPWLKSGHESLTREGAVVQSQQLVDDRALVKTSFYNDFARSCDMMHALVATVVSRPGMTAGVSCHYPGRARPPARKEIELLELLVPHLGQALRLHARLMAAPASAAVPGAVLDRATTGFILTDGRGRLRKVNATAESMLRRGDAIRTASGSVVAAKASVNSRLQAAIAAAATTGLKGGTSAGAVLQLPRGIGRLPYVASVLPVSGAGALFAQHRAAVAIIVADPEAKPHFDSAAVQSTFGWTAAETRVAMLLLTGLRPREIADQNDVSHETVRTQIKSLFAKSGIRSQAELVRVLMMTAAVLSAQG